MALPRIRLSRRRRLAVAVALLLPAAAVAWLAFPRPEAGAPLQPRAGTPARTEPARSRRGTRTVVAPRGPLQPVPILMYHVINPPIPTAPYPGLYVPWPEFSAQMHALARAGYHAVTLDQVWASWHGGRPLPPKPIVLSFDNGYRSQFTHALPTLRRLGWVGVENVQLTGLPPSQGGLGPRELRQMIRAGWELDTQGRSHADLVQLRAAGLRLEVIQPRRILQREYHVPVDWFCYPSGHYDAAVIAAVKRAGYRGSTTTIPGWAAPVSDPYRLPRLRVLRGTTPAQLLAQIDAARHDRPAPSSYGA